MVAAWHGIECDLPALRRHVSVSSKGTTLKGLIDAAGGLGLSARPVRLELDELAELKLPCILHWNLNHFVVLAEASRESITIHDPACGRQRLKLGDASRRFTGVALELQPSHAATTLPERRRLKLAQLAADASGLLRRLLTVLPIALALEAVLLVTPLLMQWVVDGAVVAADRDLLLLLGAGYSILALVHAAIGLARSWVIQDTSALLALHWSGRLFGHLLRLPVQWFERRHLGDIASRFASLATINRTLTASFAESLIDGLMAAATLSLMMAYTPPLATIALVSAALYAAVRWSGLRALQAAAAEQVALTAKANSLLFETIRAIAPIKVFNNEQARHAKWMNATVEATNRMLEAERSTAAARAVQVFISGLENVLILCLGAVAVIEGAFSVGMLIAFVAYRAIFSARVAALVDKWMQFEMLAPHRDRLEDVALAPREDFTQVTPSRATPRDATLEARGVWFRYGDMEPWILKDINLSVPAGSFVAITGASGSGKTTLLKLLMGLLTPTRGEVQIGGVPVQAIGLLQYRRRIAGVLQEDRLLAGSIAENIGLADACADRGRVESCAKAASVHEEVSAMPMGYETLVGDMGSSLSGGQKQRILLARALYKRPDVLFLDEATSHLDIANERSISTEIASLRLSRVVVAHRAETVSKADQLFELRDGRAAVDNVGH